MILSYQNLKKKYINHFENEDKCDFVLTDVLFAFYELFPLIKNENVGKVLEVGSGTSILLNELSEIFPEKIFFGVDPHERGFDKYESISKKMIFNKNMKLFHEDFDKFDQEKDFDLIYSFNVFEHLKDQNKYIDTMNNLLSLNGKSLIFCPNYDFPYEPHFVIPIIYNKEVTYKIFMCVFIEIIFIYLHAQVHQLRYITHTTTLQCHFYTLLPLRHPSCLTFARLLYSHSSALPLLP